MPVEPYLGLADVDGLYYYGIAVIAPDAVCADLPAALGLAVEIDEPWALSEAP